MNEKTEYKGYFYSIEQDENAENPRDFDHFTHMITVPQRHNKFDDEEMSREEIEEIIKRKDVIALPLIIYDHSGIWMSTGRQYPFNDPWDSSHIGFIYVTLEEIRREMGRPKPRKNNINPDIKAIKHVTKADREHAIRLMKSEVQEYSDWLSGNVWGFVVYDGEDDDVVDSCWGYYGDEGYRYAEQEAKSIIDWRVEQDAKERTEKTKEEVGC